MLLRLLLLSSVIITLVSCASPDEIHRNSLSHEITDPDRGGTTLTPDFSGPDLKVLNTAYIGGEDPTVVALEYLYLMRSSQSSDVKIEILAPDCCKDIVAGFIDSDVELWDRFSSSGAAEFRKLIQDLPIARGRELLISILAAPYGSGIVVHNEILMKSDELALIVANPVKTKMPFGNWVLEGLQHAAHELLHANYSFLGVGLTRRSYSQTNEETAAWLYGFCASTRIALALGSKKATLMSSNEFVEKRILQVVPTLSEGRFCPDRRMLNAYSSDSERGGVLANAVLKMLFPTGVISADSNDHVDTLISLCERLPDKVPEFLEGELPGIQKKSVCI